MPVQHFNVTLVLSVCISQTPVFSKAMKRLQVNDLRGLRAMGNITEEYLSFCHGCFSYALQFSVFDKGIIIRHLKNGANLHETAAIGETQSGGFFCDMAGVYWGPPCFGYQGGPQQTPAIPPAKSNYRAVTSRHFVPKLSLSPRIFA